MLKHIIKRINGAHLEKKYGFSTNDITKLICLGLAYFFIIGSYSILKPLKTSIFLGLVGKEWQPISRLITPFIIFPCGLLYSRFVDKYKRHQIFSVIIGIYGVLSIVFTLLLAHPTIGISNTHTSPYRILGWVFELFMDLYSAIVVSTFWGFANSISTPSFANKSYGIMTAISRIGGISTTILALILLDIFPLPKVVSIPGLTSLAGLLLFCAIACIYYIIKNVPDNALHGYEAAYKEEVKREKKHEKTGVFEGIRLMLMEPYVFGIFGMVYAFEIVSIIFDYQMNVLMSICLNNDIGAMSSFNYWNTLAFQIVALFLSVFGTSTLLEKIGTVNCLLLVPMCLIGLSGLLLIWPTLTTIFIVMVILRGLNYGFNVPVRETLYIPTVKDIQFKAKVWIDSFGRTLSKTSGSAINTAYAALSPASCLFISSWIAIIISCIYAGVSLAVGHRYNKTIASNDVIGKAD